MSKCVISSWADANHLTQAWGTVRRNKGRAGADGQSVSDFEQQSATHINSLSRELKLGRYRPFRNFRVSKIKPDGSRRVIQIPTVRDRIAQTACAGALVTRADKAMGRTSFAYRPGIGVETAAGRVTQLRLHGWQYGFRADIKQYFDQISHSSMLDAMEPFVPCSGTAKVASTWIGRSGKWARGIAQGSPLSPVLANIFLIEFDREIDRGRFRLVRYADDMLVLARNLQTISKAEVIIQNALRDRGLSLNTQKSGCVTFTHGFEFLGLWFQGGSVLQSKAQKFPSEMIF